MGVTGLPATPDGVTAAGRALPGKGTVPGCQAPSAGSRAVLWACGARGLMSVRGVWEAAGGIHGPGRSRPPRGRARDPGQPRLGPPGSPARPAAQTGEQTPPRHACGRLPHAGASPGAAFGRRPWRVRPVRPRPLCTRPRHRRRAAGSTGTGGDTEEPADAREPAPAFRPRQHRERQGGDGGRRVRLGQASARRCDADGVLVTTGRDAA